MYNSFGFIHRLVFHIPDLMTVDQVQKISQLLMCELCQSFGLADIVIDIYE